jgi:hypothetical protein
MSIIQQSLAMIAQALSRTRRNHALEHATIHILSERHPQRAVAGRSDSRGFFIYTDLPAQEIQRAIEEAQRRLAGGESGLAIHPNCGTNLLTAGALSSAAVYLTMLGQPRLDWRDRLSRLPLATLAAMLALLIAQPLGRRFQLHLTTEAQLDGLKVKRIQQLGTGKRKLYRVLTGES